jgi:hypothetical protein
MRTRRAKQVSAITHHHTSEAGDSIRKTGRASATGQGTDRDCLEEPVEKNHCPPPRGSFARLMHSWQSFHLTMQDNLFWGERASSLQARKLLTVFRRRIQRI